MVEKVEPQRHDGLNEEKRVSCQQKPFVLFVTSWFKFLNHKDTKATKKKTVDAPCLFDKHKLIHVQHEPADVGQAVLFRERREDGQFVRVGIALQRESKQGCELIRRF